MPACCICQSDAQAEPLERFAPWSVAACAGCGLVYLAEDPPSQEAFVADAEGQLAATGPDKGVEYWSFPHLYGRHRHVFETYFAERLTRLQDYATPMRHVLDIGCGFGFFMAYLRGRGVSCAGLDIDAESVAHAREELGLPVVQEAFEDYHGRGPFDALVACDVLEHVLDPVGFLAKCRTLLRPGGVLYLQVPNVLGDVLPPGGSFNWPYHLWQFGPQTLERLLVQNGYEICDWWTGVMGVVGVYEAGGPDENMRLMWERARTEKRGNRLQMLARPC